MKKYRILLIIKKNLLHLEDFSLLLNIIRIMLSESDLLYFLRSKGCFKNNKIIDISSTIIDISIHICRHTYTATPFRSIA